MAELHRLQSCRRCRHLFVARPGERVCPDCRTAMRRERSHRALFRRSGSRSLAEPWTPVAIFALGTVGAAVLAAIVAPAYGGIAAWIGGAGALAFISRQP